MSTGASADAAHARVSKQAVARQFVRLYYSILNSHNGYLFQFYGKNSTVTIRESLRENQTLTETAEDETAVKELLQSLYANVSVKVESAVPQFSVDDCVLLHVNGIIYRKSMDGQRAFTQAFVLCPQENGYYVRTDVAHVLGFGYDRPLLDYWGPDAGGVTEPRVTNPSSSDSEKEMMAFQLGSYQGVLPEDGGDLRTATPPLEDAPRLKPMESDLSEGEEFTTKKQPQPWIMRSQGMKTPSVTHPAAVPLMMAPPLAMPPIHVPAVSFAMPMVPAAAKYVRQRSMSMGCDPWGHGVFIARLPFGVQPSDVEEAFTKFGPILGGREGIQVRDGRNGCYAFVTFENAESARTAIQQGAVLQGKRVFIEPRYPRREAEPALVAYPPMMAPPVAHYPVRPAAPIPRMP